MPKPSRTYAYDVNPILDLVDTSAIIDADWDAYDRAQLLAMLRDTPSALDVDAIRDLLDERDY